MCWHPRQGRNNTQEISLERGNGEAQRDYRRVTRISNSSSSEADITPPIQAPKIRGYTTKEKLKVIAGAVTALVIVGWLVVFALR
jgi:hypothetical protein